jgi:hypothetical protein
MHPTNPHSGNGEAGIAFRVARLFDVGWRSKRETSLHLLDFYP